MRFSFRLDSSRDYHYGTHPEEVNRLRREDNPATIKKYPILSFNDFVRSYVPKGVPNGEFAKYLKRALGHWKWKQFDTPNKWTKRFRSWWTRDMVRLRMSSWRGLRCFSRGSEIYKENKLCWIKTRNTIFLFKGVAFCFQSAFHRGRECNPLIPDHHCYCEVFFQSAFHRGRGIIANSNNFVYFCRKSPCVFRRKAICDDEE